MKLSEILKDWPIKSDMDLSWLGGDKKEITEIQHQQSGWNTSLTSCDREIDREELTEILKECSLCHLAFSHLGECEKEVIELRDLIISTIPTWLKPTERK